MTKDGHRRVGRGIRSALWLGVLLGLTGTAYGQVETKLTASDAAADDVFGISVSLDGDRAIVGAYQGGAGGTSTGSAYLFRRNGARWVEESKLMPSDGVFDDRFGVSVSLRGDRVLIGASGDDDAGYTAGSAYLFRFDGGAWVEEAELMAGDAVEDARFGSSVALSDDRAVIGASRDDDAGDAAGAVYIFEREDTMWVETAKLTASDAAVNDRFGASVSQRGDRILVGAYLDDDNGSVSGAAYVFEFDGTAWVETAKLTAGDAGSGDRFGYSVSLDGDRALIGAHGDRSESGSAYVFRFDGTSWVEEAKLRANDAASNDNFGVAVSLSGDGALIGAWGNADAGLVTGSAYLFRLEGTAWEQEAKIVPDDAAAGDGFGLSVALDGEGMLIGAYGDDDAGLSSGAAYLFEPMINVAIDDAAAVPTTYSLHPNYPNPFNPETVLRFDLPQAAHARLIIYDMMSREVARLLDTPLGAGTHAVTWQAEGLPSGVYVYRLETGAYSAARTMVLFR